MSFVFLFRILLFFLPSILIFLAFFFALSSNLVFSSFLIIFNIFFVLLFRPFASFSSYSRPAFTIVYLAISNSIPISIFFLSFQLPLSYSLLTLFPVVFSQFSIYLPLFIFKFVCSFFYPFLSSQLSSLHSLRTLFPVVFLQFSIYFSPFCFNLSPFLLLLPPSPAHFLPIFNI